MRACRPSHCVKLYIGICFRLSLFPHHVSSSSSCCPHDPQILDGYGTEPRQGGGADDVREGNSLVSCCCVVRRLSREDLLSATREVESPQVQRAPPIISQATVGAPPKDTSEGSHSRSPARLKMQVATDDRCCCSEDAAAAVTRRSLALDRLQALLGLEGEYYNNSRTPMLTTVANSNGAASASRRRQPLRRSTRPAGSAGASGGSVCGVGYNYSAMRGGGGAAFGGSSTFRYLAKFSESRGRVCSWAYGGTFRGRREMCTLVGRRLSLTLRSCEKSSITSAFPAGLWAG
jgi:hypothetical protein